MHLKNSEENTSRLTSVDRSLRRARFQDQGALILTGYDPYILFMSLINMYRGDWIPSVAFKINSPLSRDR